MVSYTKIKSIITYLGKLSVSFWHQVLKPIVTMMAAAAPSAHITVHPTVSKNADRNELSVFLHRNIHNLPIEIYDINKEFPEAIDRTESSAQFSR